jgi:hypothetical protein
VTEAKAIDLMIDHLEGLFPKDYPSCRRRFASLREFFAEAHPVGQPISYDLEEGNTNPKQPVGAVALSNCPCGTTLALSSDGMPLLRLWAVLTWAHFEARRRRISHRDLLQYLRWETRKKVLARPPSGLAGQSA